MAGAAAGWLALGRGWFGWEWLIVPLALFVVLVVWHERTQRRWQRATRAVAFYENGLERLEDRWAGAGVAGTRFANPSHPYAGDLDVFGPGSLFERLCSARTQVGEACLAAWLCVPATADVIRARQAAVQELQPRLDLREDLALLGEAVRPGIGAARAGGDTEALAAWGAARLLPAPRAVRLVAALLAAAAAAALVAWVGGAAPVPFYALLLVGQAFAWKQRVSVRQALRDVETFGKALELLSQLLARIERERFRSPALEQLRTALDDQHGRPPSQVIAHLQRLIERLQAQQNQVFAPLGFVLLWTTQCGLAIGAWRAAHGPQVAGWLRVIGEFEALGALASYAFECPDDPFPQIVDDGPCLEAEALAHPLLPVRGAVRNDLSLGKEILLFLVSGSNMSGKSTWLRTIGTNTVLALAGAPVRARSFRLSPFRVGASLQVQDSLQEGVSRFYAEIMRLRQVVELGGGAPPLLFLLDEILHGTNSHDRRVGAEAVVRALVRRGAVGLVTTHDLALTQIAEDPVLRAVNVHFEDQLDAGKMFFDYRLRTGVVEKSNAIALMRAVGLEV